MARKYTRDNRGRFASVGATARGGRLKTAGGNKRKSQKISALSGDRMSSVPKGTIGRTRKQRQITMIDRPQAKRPAYNAGRSQQVAAIAARKAPKPVAAKRIKAAAPANTVANKTGQSKTLNKFNSRPERTRGAYVGGRYVSKEKLSGRQPLDMGYGSDRAYGRVATKAARKRAANSAAKPAAKRIQVVAKPVAPKNTKVVLDEARWRRVVQRVQTRGIMRGSLEADRPGGPFNASSEKRGLRAMRTQVNAERFIKGLTRSKGDSSKLASGLNELNSNFQSRPRFGTGSTSIGVAARNKQAIAERKAKRAASKAARKAKASRSAIKSAKSSKRKAAQRLKASSLPGTIKPARAKVNTEGDRVVRDLMRAMPTVPTRRKPDYIDSKSKLSSTSLSFDQPRRLSAKDIASMQKSLGANGWSSRSNALGNQVTYSKNFNGAGGASETAKIRLSRKGGPLMSGQVEVSRSVSARQGKRGAGGSIIEYKYRLPRKPRLNSTPRRKKRS